MNCSICNRPINEGETMTMYTEKNSNKRLFAHDECLASMVAKDLSDLQSGAHTSQEKS